jgi:hypothetical protein
MKILEKEGIRGSGREEENLTGCEHLGLWKTRLELIVVEYEGQDNS